MKEIIEQIIVINDPGISSHDIKDNPDLWYLQAQELTIDDIKEYGETFFSIGFHVDFYLTDNRCFSCIKIDKNIWEIANTAPEDKIDGISAIVQYKGTLLEVLDQFRKDYVSKFQIN